MIECGIAFAVFCVAWGAASAVALVIYGLSLWSSWDDF